MGGLYKYLCIPDCPIDGTTAAAGTIYITDYLISLSFGHLSNTELSKNKGEQITYITLERLAHPCQTIKGNRSPT